MTNLLTNLNDAQKEAVTSNKIRTSGSNGSKGWSIS